MRIFQIQNRFFLITYLTDYLQCFWSPECFESFQKIDNRAFWFKHRNSKLKMSVTWKCFDGIQREEMSISDVRNKFRFK